MIRVILLGRTGNHLFQYALGRVLSARHGVPLVLDASWFNSEGWREVSHFLKQPLRAKVVRRFSLGTRILRRITDKHYWEFGSTPMIRESADDQSFSPEILDAPPDCVLFGYFQSHRYFESIRDELRQELRTLLENVARTSRTEPPGETLGSADSVAIHVRRGDYLSHPIFDICTIAYYRKAIQRMRELLPSPRFTVFSDDPDWCRKTFTDSDIRVIPRNRFSANPLHDLRRMSLASHHIIANSSYSWWAAWIGEKPNQKVLMPNRWYAGGIHSPIEDRRPVGWETIDPDSP